VVREKEYAGLVARHEAVLVQRQVESSCCPNHYPRQRRVRQCAM